MRHILWIIFFCSVALSNSVFASSGVYFKETFFPLKVYFLKGEHPGPTIMLQGGIQGDELTGVICAQILSKAKVKKGSLIIVPRANWPSLFLFKRQVHVDLNRRFDKNYREYYEDSLAQAIFYLVGLSDGLIHLHEGSGFYSKYYIDVLRNPKRYGQSIIIDEPVYEHIYLASVAKTVLSDVNPQVTPSKYSFSLFNMNTFSPTTLYPEQKKSLTYNVLKNYIKPAFAIEVSKNIKDLSWKAKHMLMLIKRLCAEMGVEFEFPWNKEIEKDIKNWFKQRIDFQIYRVNNFVFKVHLSYPKSVEVGVKVGDIDIDLKNKEFVLFPGQRTNIAFILDGKNVLQKKIGQSKYYSSCIGYPLLIYSLDGKVKCAFPGETIKAFEGQTLIVYGLWPNKREVINVKGYIKFNSLTNTGQDIDSPIYLTKNVFMSKYIKVLNDNTWQFDIIRETKNSYPYKWRVLVSKAKLEYIVLIDKKNSQYTLLKSKIKQGDYKIKIYPEKYFCLFLDKYPLPYYSGDILKLEEGLHRITIRNALNFDLVKKEDIYVSP